MNKLLFLALWLLTLIFSYWVGISSNDVKYSIPSEDPSTQVDSSVYSVLEPAFEPPLIPSGIQGQPADNKLSKVSSLPYTKTISEESESISLQAKLRSSHPVQRLEAFAELLKNPNQSSIDSALEAYNSLPHGPGRFSELKMISYSWGQVDPVSALQWANSQKHWDQHVARASIMDAWARNDSDGAIQWAKENFDGEENPYFVGIINGLSEKSLPQATDLMTELPYGRVRGRSAAILFEKVWSKGEDVALHWAEHLPEGSLQDFAYGELGSKLASQDISRAVEWVESMAESSVKVAVSEDVSREMARKDPQKAANWASNLPNGKSKNVSLLQVAEMWTRTDPIATAEWINQIPADINKDPLIETLVNKIHKSDPENAKIWAESITNPDRRKHMLQKVEKQSRQVSKPEKK